MKIIALIFCFFISTGTYSCTKQKENQTALILEHYSDDLQFTIDDRLNSPLYFIPVSVYWNFLDIYESFDPLVEYDESVLEFFSPDYIRSNIHEIYPVWLFSEKLPSVIQFPNRIIFDEYLELFEENPMVTKDVLEQLLQFEYSIYIINEGIAFETDNYISTDRFALFNGEHRYWLNDEYYEYLVSDEFIRDLHEVRTLIQEKAGSP